MRRFDKRPLRLPPESPRRGDPTMPNATGRHIWPNGERLAIHVLCRTQRELNRAFVAVGIHCPGSNSIGRVVGPLSELSGFHGAGPVRLAFGMRRAILASASASSSLARLTPRQ